MSKIHYSWDEDEAGRSLLILEKKRGKIKISEIEEFLKYDAPTKSDFSLEFSQKESTYEPSGIDFDSSKGDCVVLVEKEEIIDYE